MSKRMFVAAALAAAAALALGGCGEPRQEAVYKQGKYQGKPDNQPWDNDPSASLYTSSKWTKGDKNSWEDALKQRALAQNEYNRVQ